MSSYKEYPPADLRLIGYDPVRDLPQDHLARLVDRIVDGAVVVPERSFGVGQPAFNPRLPLKVVVYAYCIGVRSSRQMERMCRESLPFLLLTRGVPAPSYRTLCSTRVECQSQLEEVFQCLFAVAAEVGLPRLGRITVDSTKFRANAGPEAVVRQNEYAAMREELKRILVEAAEADAREDVEGAATETVVGKSVPADQMRDIVRRVRGYQSDRKREQNHEPGHNQSLVESTGETATAVVPDPVEAGLPDSAPEPETKAVLGQSMRKRIVPAVAAIDAAEADGRKHLCLTDPDARMLGEGRTKQIRECHSLEIATDNGLIVAAGVATNQDTDRLLPLVEMAKQNEPGGIVAAIGDCGFWKGDSIGGTGEIRNRDVYPEHCDGLRHASWSLCWDDPLKATWESAVHVRR